MSSRVALKLRLKSAQGSFCLWSTPPEIVAYARSAYKGNWAGKNFRRPFKKLRVTYP